MAEKFRPVQGSENDIINSSPVEGWLYFSTDTKRIFMVKDGEFLPMGGNSGIYYGSREMSDEEKEDPELTTFIFSTDNIEDGKVPNVNDLILNIPDGCFYRVTYIDEEQMITTSKLTIAGSGGGPGGGGGGSDTPSVKIRWTDHSPTRDFVVGDKEMIVSFSASATNNIEGNKIERVIIKIGAGADAKTLADVTKTYEFGDVISINIAENASMLNTGGANTLKYTIIDSYGQEFKPSSSFNTIFRLHDLKLVPTFDTIKTLVDETTFKYTCNVSGGNSLERYVQITIAPESNPNAPIYENSKTKVTKAGSITIPIEDLPVENMQHGVYVLTASLCALIDGNRTISSPSSSHQIIYYRTEVNTPLIAAHVPSTKVTQYDTSLITYVVVNEQSSLLEVPMLLITEGESTLTANAVLKEENIWKKTFNKAGFYNLSIQYGKDGIIKTLPKIEVSEYEGEIPTIDETNLELYLTSQERTNSDANREVWEYKGIKAQFDKFLWGSANGWVEDPNGDVALKLTNGAKLTIPEYSPFATNATSYGLTIELDFMLSGVTDYSKPLIHCLSKDAEGNIATGFNITGQKATLNSNLRKATTTAIGGEEDSSGNINEDDMALQAFTQYYNEDERIHLAYVVDLVPAKKPEGSYYFVYTYLNGVLSGIMSLSANEKFEDDRFSPAMFEFDSTYGDIYVYNVRVYRSASDSRAVINNYIADLVNIDDKIELYKINKIFTDEGLINIKAIQDIAYQLNVPYVLFKGGSKMPKKLSSTITYTDAPSYALPLTKSDYRLMSMRMYDRHKDNENPVIDIPIELEDEAGNVINDFKDIQVNTSYKMKRGVQVYGQGTSSMVYPVKNLRLKFKKEEDYPIVYDGAYPVEIACFKADFMDSSASHNTGTANLVYDLLKLMNLRSPAQAFKEDSSHVGKDGVAKYDLLTAIRGFPIVCFYTEGDSDDYTYIGRYNFNIDKATPEPFGFFGQKVYTGKTTTDEQGRVRQEVECVGLLTEEVNGMTVLPLDENNEEVERDLIQCWEILNNDTGSPTKFLTSRDYLEKVIKGMGLEWNTKTNYFRQFAPGELFRRTLEYADIDAKAYGWMDYYEDRYPDAMVSGGAFALGDTEEDEYKNLTEDLNNGIFRLACWLNSTALPLEGEEDYVTNEISYREIEPAFYPTRDASYNPAKQYYIKNGDTFEEKVITLDTVATYSTDVVGNTNDKLDPSKITSVTIDKNIFGEKVGQFGDYIFVYSTETGTWQFDSKEDVGSELSAYGITYTGDPVDAACIKVSYVQTNDWEKTLYEKYTIDNADYRLAKFKAEFTDYIDLKFALFYYTLTMVLLMMDSRAKNMMLATWDQKIWYPIFYDMDTALGLNNTGFNKFAYDTEDDPSDKVFNGFDSVLWNNFRTCFYSEICDFYAELRKHLTIGKLLTTYNANASDKWNEALTTADAEYKYIRPYEEGYYDGKNTDKDGNPVFVKPGTTSYLYAGQGKRTNHRSYWLTNRANYFDSKYIPLTLDPKSGITISAFNFRAYALPEQKSSAKTAECVAQTPANHRFEITALNNSYQSIYIGNILYGPEYTLANQKVTLGPLQVKHEVESYVLNPSLIMSLGDLSDKYLGQFNFPTDPTRLTELNFGRSSRSHKDAYDKYYNNLLSTLSIGESCPYLQKINIARCTGLVDINLEKCPRLKELDAEGSKLTSITFPSDSIIEKLYLPNSLQVLELTNQPHLNTIEFDINNEGKHGASNIKEIRLDRISNIDTYPIVKAMMSNDATVGSKDYKLLSVNWTLNSEDDFTYDASGKVESIVILDKLQLAQPVDSLPFAQALTGTMTIEINKTIDQYAMYDKYNKIFPNLEIIYAESTPIIPAKTIRFFNDSQDNNPEEHYYVYTDGTENLQYLVSKEGPKGAALTSPAKASTNENSFKFTGRWESNGVLYTNNPEDTEPGVIQFADCTPEEDKNFYAVYEVTERIYTVSFRDYDDTEVNRVEGAYNDSLASVVNYHYRDSSDLDIYERWAFQGWSTAKYNDGPRPNAIYVDLSTLRLTSDMILHAHYIKEDVRLVATNESYFDFVDYKTSITKDGVTTEYSGLKISIKAEYRDSLAGKITLPLTHNGKDIISVGYCKAKNVTHVFFLTTAESKYVEIDKAFNESDNTLASQYQLKAFYMPDTVMRINSSAFNGAYKLEEMNWHDNLVEIGQDAFYWSNSGGNQLKMDELPLSLEKIGGSAFFGAARDNFKVTKIPPKLKTIETWAFYPGTYVAIEDFNGTLQKIGNSALSRAGNNIQTDTIYIRSNVTTIEPNAFGDGLTNVYGNKKIKNVYFENPYVVYLDELGLEEDLTLEMQRETAKAMGFIVSDPTFNPVFDVKDISE